MFKSIFLAASLILTSTFAVAQEVKVPETQIIGITDLGTPEKSVIMETETNPTEPAQKVERMIIKNDPGGSLDEYIQSLMYAKGKGMKFKVDGMCASACTLILAKQLELDICVTDNAVFGIHKPFMVSVENRRMEISYTLTSVVVAESTWENLFLEVYPDWVVELIKRNGGVPSVYNGATPSDLFKIDSVLIGERIKKCE